MTLILKVWRITSHGSEALINAGYQRSQLGDACAQQYDTLKRTQNRSDLLGEVVHLCLDCQVVTSATKVAKWPGGKLVAKGCTLVPQNFCSACLQMPQQLDNVSPAATRGPGQGRSCRVISFPN